MTEEELVKQIKKGSKSAFDDLVNAYSGRVINIAHSLLGDREEALDAAQEIFVKVYKNISSFRGESSVSTWIYRITKNVCTDFLRKRKAVIISLDDEKDDEQKFEIPDETSAPEEVFERRERITLVRNAIASLDENQKAVITLFDINGLSYEEIAAVLRCPVGTVKSRLYRARETLRKILAKDMELFL